MLEIRPISLADVVAYREAVAAVMSERRFLAYTEVFSLEESAAFVAKNIRLKNPHWIAIDNTKAIGWCDIRREEIPVYKHCGILGMGVIATHRGQGIGERLIRAALEAAQQAKFERIELSVYASNTAAQALYNKLGFVEEGRKIRGRKLDDEYEDVLLMAKRFP